MSDYLVALAYLAFLVLGVAAPFVFSLGYVWVDTFYPQYVGKYLMGDVPVAAVMGLAALISYVLLDRRSPPRVGLVILLIVAMGAWSTATLMWSVMPDEAWKKWDWAFKSVMFAAFVPFVFRSRVQIESLIQVFILGSAMHMIAVGIKSAITGGGYRMNLTFIPGDLGLGESSAMATAAIMFIPLLLWLRRHSVILPWKWFRNAFCVTMVCLCFPAAIGTGARTGIVAMVVLGGLYWLQSKRKLLSGLFVVILSLLVFIFSPDRWKDRMLTIQSYDQESSALTRLKVWEWIIDFARDHPFGAGFRAFYVNVIHMPPDAFHPEGWVQRGRAPHSTWFELLNEVGYPGLILFLILIVMTLGGLYRLWRRTQGIEELAWCRDLARALGMAMIILMAGGTFIGIAFQPWFWLMFSISFCLSEYVRRVLTPATSDHRYSRHVEASARRSLPMRPVTHA